MNAQDVRTMVEYINQTDYEPSDWENSFIDSILKWRGPLTVKQTETMQKIYEKATSKGN